MKKGEVIGLVNGKLKVKGKAPNEVTRAALETIQAEEYEIITIYYGETVTIDEAQELAEEIEELYPEQEIEVVDGGQPHYCYILSAE